MARLFDTGIFSVEALNGAVGVGYSLYFYATGTSTPKATYPTSADADAGTNANANPVLSTADGRFPAIWLASGGYKLALKDALGSTLVTRDPADNDFLTQLATGTGAFWTAWNTGTYPAPSPLGSHVQRLNDRLFVGAATVTTGDFPATTKDYYETFEAAHTSPFGFRTSWAQFASGATNGGIGVLGFARSSDSALDGLQLGMGGCFAGINDNTTHQQHVAGLYAVAFRLPGAGQTTTGTGTIGGEVDICNLGGSVQITPGNLYPTTGFTTAWQVNSGAAATGAATASAGITIGNNGANFNSGIIIGQNALAGLTYDGTGKATSGTASAMRLGAFQQIEWWTYPFAAASFTITSQQLTAANAQSIIAKDTGIEFGGPAAAGLALKTFYPGGVTGAYVGVTPASGANAPIISAEGATNSDIQIKGRGTGGINITAPNDAARIYATTVGLGFFGNTPIAKPTITGSRGGNAALASLLTQLAIYGLVTDSSS